MTNNELYHSYVARNPHHDATNPLYSPLGTMPSDLVNNEESDGYAKPSSVVSKTSNLSRRPSDYLEPVSPAHRGRGETPTHHRLQPLDTSTTFTNRLSGIYEDPDYATIAEVKSTNRGTSNHSDKEDSSGVRADKRESNKTTVVSKADGEYDKLSFK